MADEADVANDRQEIETARYLAGLTRYAGISADDCEQCGAEIPVARQIAVPGVQLCVTCANRAELAAKGVRRV
jgi:phage/conjugal plasmid C-4 type zinc finger TraR family protein